MVIAEDEKLGAGSLPPAPIRPGVRRRFCFATTKPTSRNSLAAPLQTPYPKDGINDHVVNGAATVNPDERGTKMACLVSRHGRGRRDGRAQAPAGARRSGRTLDLGDGLRANASRPKPRSRRILRGATPEGASDEEAHGDAAGVRGNGAGACNSIIMTSRAGSTGDKIRPLRGTQIRPQLGLAPPQQPPHRRDARQMGISLVRFVGSRLSQRGARPHRPGDGEESTAAAGARMVHASERPVAGLRMEFRRCESAGSGMGRAGGVPHRWRHRISISSRAFSTSS